MIGTLSYPSPSADPIQEEVRRPLSQVISDLFETNAAANTLMIFTIVIGFIHGWLKVKFRHPIITFAFDFPLVITMILVIMSKNRERLIPNSKIGDALKYHFILGLIYIPLSVLIWEMPIVAVLAAFRGWCVIPFAFVVGYHITTSIRQVEFYMWLVIILGFATALYGIQQSIEDIRALMAADPEMEYRFRNQFYSMNGKQVFRKISTYVSSAVFAAQLSYSITFALARLSVKSCPMKERMIIGIMMATMAYALIETGSRTAVLQLGAAVLFTLIYRRGGIQLGIIPIIIFIVWKFLGSSVAETSADRYGTLMDSQTIFFRFWIVLLPSWEAFLESPLGTGLGSSSHGLPMFLVFALVAAGKLRMIDGDLGHLVVDMGLPGLIILGNLLVKACLESWHSMFRLRNTVMSIIALPAGLFFIENIVAFPIGTPFLGIPYGVLIWFFLGALCRLNTDYKKLTESPDINTPIFNAKFTSFILKPQIKSLFHTPDQQSSTSDSSLNKFTNNKKYRTNFSANYPERATESNKNIKRFLYFKPNKKTVY